MNLKNIDPIIKVSLLSKSYKINLTTFSAIREMRALPCISPSTSTNIPTDALMEVYCEQMLDVLEKLFEEKIDREALQAIKLHKRYFFIRSAYVRIHNEITEALDHHLAIRYGIEKDMQKFVEMRELLQYVKGQVSNDVSADNVRRSED